MISKAVLRSAALAVFAAIALPSAGIAQTPTTGPGSTAQQDAGLQAAIRKANAYTALLNRTLRALQSWERYTSWVDLKKGPTGKERYISYGLYSLYDVNREIEGAEKAMASEPSLPEIDTAMGRYIKAYQDLAPVITRAERYYDRKDYTEDGAAEGRKLHEQLVPLAQAFLAARAAIDAKMRVWKRDLDRRELAAIEKADGRSARWQIRNIMIAARAVIDLMPSNDNPILDLKAFDAAILDYSAAVKEMDKFKENDPKGVPMIESQASSWLGKLRDFRDKAAKAKGDVRRGAANDANWIVNSYNTMVTLSQTALTMPR